MDAGTEKNNLGWLNPHVLTDFIDELRDAGYKIGISQYIAAQDLILALTAQGKTLNKPERLKTLLGPIFCSSPAEQEDFQQRFDRWVEFVSQTGRATERADVKAQALSKELGKIRRGFRQLILTLIAIILTGIFLPILLKQFIYDSSQPKQPSAKQPSATQPSATQPSATQPSATQSNPHFPLDLQISPFCFLLTLYIAFLVWRLWWLWRTNLFLQRHGTTEQPELHKISIRDFEQNLFPTIMFIHTAQSLRHRIRIPSNELDVDTTIDATLRQGGWLTPVYGTRQVLPEYLFLINRASYRDHQARFMEEMVDLLRHNGVFITSYFFDDDPRICFPSDSTSSPRKLHEITAKYTQHRLVIVSDTEKLFSTQTGELEPWVSQMTTWGNRAILTPKPVENWGYQELELARQFIVLPATSKGVRVLSQVLHQGAATYVLSEKAQISLPEPLRVRPNYWIERNPPKPEQINAMLKSLREYLGKDGFYWLSACAVFPELHWNITIYLGNVLKTAEGHCLLEVCSLTNLARLPWFRYGDMPDWLRSLLIATLTDEQKHTIRTALQDLLITAVQGTVGRLQLEVAQKHHSFLPKLANSILSLLSRRATEGSPLRDYLFLSFMTGQPKLAIEVSDTFSRLLLQKQKRLHWLIEIGIMVTVTTTYLWFPDIWPSARTQVKVSAQSDPWLAGMPDKSQASSCNTLVGFPPSIAPQNSPTQVKEIPLIPNSHLTFKVNQEEKTQVYYRQPFFGAKGNINNPATHDKKAENGISDIQAPIASLVGVFLGAEQPNKDSAPSTLDFSVEALQNYFTISPQLKQVFFIGNGRTYMGIQQRVTVPLGAKRLYLGIMDGCSWGDNVGSLDVEVSNH